MKQQVQKGKTKMAKYRCDKTKDEILEIVVKHLTEASSHEIYVAMINLVSELKIYETETEAE